MGVYIGWVHTRQILGFKNVSYSGIIITSTVQPPQWRTI